MNDQILSVTNIGCCGAYCGTCPALRDETCKSCKAGYKDGNRDLNKAKCRIKICCITHGYISCADCPNYINCKTLQTFYSKNGYKYAKYKHATAFIRAHGYDTFLSISTKWHNAYGKYPKAEIKG